MMKPLTWVLCAVFASAFASGGDIKPEITPFLSTVEIMHSRMFYYPQLAGVAEKTDDGYKITFTPLDAPAFSQAGPVLPDGACDSTEECATATSKMCKDAGHGDIKEDSTTITEHISGGGSTCSSDCKNNGAVAFVTCNPK